MTPSGTDIRRKLMDLEARRHGSDPLQRAYIEAAIDALRWVLGYGAQPGGLFA